MGKNTNMKKCAKCKREFNKKLKGRLKLSEKVSKGEDIIYICPDCSIEIKNAIRSVKNE